MSPHNWDCAWYHNVTDAQDFLPGVKSVRTRCFDSPWLSSGLLAVSMQSELVEWWGGCSVAARGTALLAVRASYRGECELWLLKENLRKFCGKSAATNSLFDVWKINILPVEELGPGMLCVRAGDAITGEVMLGGKECKVWDIIGERMAGDAIGWFGLRNEAVIFRS